MSGVNKAILLGRIGNIETTYTPQGMCVCKFSLATSRKGKDGNEITSWHRCVAFDKRAEIIGQYTSKGRELYIEGELSYGQYEKDGITRYTTDIIVREFSFIGGNQQNQSYQKPEQPNKQYSNVGNQAPPDDDIPF